MKLVVFWRFRIFIPMGAAERLENNDFTRFLLYCDVAWHRCRNYKSDALESLQHNAKKLIFSKLNSGFYTKEPNATLGLVLLINRRKFTFSCQLENALMVQYPLISIII